MYVCIWEGGREERREGSKEGERKREGEFIMHTLSVALKNMQGMVSRVMTTSSFDFK